MNPTLSKYTFGGHGSFQLRYGWLTKGYRAFKENNNIFSLNEATVTLGVGKNMVDSISYWLKATDIIHHKNITDFGEKLLGEFDPYLEDDATLWLLHLKLSQNKELSTSIYWLFNHFHKTNFTTDEAFIALQEFIATNPNIQASENTVKKDIGVILRMYAPHKSDQTRIDDMLESPLSLLKLIEYHDGRYHFLQPEKKQIPIEVIAYAIREYFPDKNIIPVKELMYGDQLVLNKVLKISEDDLISYLEDLIRKYPKDYQLKEDAGIFQLHISSKRKALAYLKKYYEQTCDQFNRVWQGSDFDLNQAIEEQLTQLTTVNIVEHLNKNQVFLPFVAKRYSIEKHSLFYFEPVFIYADQYADIKPKNNKPRIIFCFNFNNEDKHIFKNKIIKYFGEQDICVLIDNSKNIRTAIQYCIALENIEKQNDVVQKNPIIHCEFTQHLIDAKQKEYAQLNKILENPEKCLWYNKAKRIKCNNKRAVRTLLSETLENIYPDAPTIKNELINRDNPSAPANTGRRKLLLHLLKHHDKEDLAIEKYPAEKSMYDAIIKENEIHKKINGKWQICRPTDEKCRGVWNEIDRFFKQTKEQPKCLLELDEILTAPPFGIKKPVLPIFYIANYLYNKNEIAIYEYRIYVPFFTEQHLERFLKRPDTFTFQQSKVE